MSLNSRLEKNILSQSLSVINLNWWNQSVLSWYAIIGFQWTKVSYFGDSVTKIYMTQEDYKTVIICVHCCQIPIYIAVMSIYQLQIIFTLLYIESMPVYFMIQYYILLSCPLCSVANHIDSVVYWIYASMFHDPI